MYFSVNCMSPLHFAQTFNSPGRGREPPRRSDTCIASIVTAQLLRVGAIFALPSCMPAEKRSDTGPFVVAIFNTAQDLVDLLRHVFEQAGFVVVTLLTTQIRDGEVELETFLRQHKPHVIVYDLAPPYDANYRLFQHVCAMPAMVKTSIVLTSTSPSRAKEIAGTNEKVYEVVGKPFDLDQIIAAVRQAARSRPTK
jgi:CheY-like chemotaxis protein